MTALVAAFKTGRVPLRNLNLSQNKLGDAGVAALAEIAEQRILMTNLKSLNIEHNDIGNSGAIVLFSALGALGRDDIEAAVLLGVIERGETKHGLVMGQAIFPKVMDLQLQYKKPVGIGIIGPEVEEHQIDPRVEPHARAAMSAVKELLDIANTL